VAVTPVVTDPNRAGSRDTMSDSADVSMRAMHRIAHIRLPSASDRRADVVHSFATHER
jgi:hypothetical protein